MGPGRRASYFQFSARDGQAHAPRGLDRRLRGHGRRLRGRVRVAGPPSSPTASRRRRSSPTSGPRPTFGVEPSGYFVIAGRLNPENNIDAVAAAYAGVVGAACRCSCSARPTTTRRCRRGWTTWPAATTASGCVGHVDDRRTRSSACSPSSAAYLHGHSVGGMNPSLVEAMGAAALVAALDTAFNRETARRRRSLLRAGLRRRGDGRSTRRARAAGDRAAAISAARAADRVARALRRWTTSSTPTRSCCSEATVRGPAPPGRAASHPWSTRDRPAPALLVVAPERRALRRRTGPCSPRCPSWSTPSPSSLAVPAGRSGGRAGPGARGRGGGGARLRHPAAPPGARRRSVPGSGGCARSPSLV